MRQAIGQTRLAASGLCKSFGGRRVVEEASLHIDPGEIVGLLGPNGAGKTTTFSMIVGIETPEAGSVSLGDRDITRLALHQRARLGIGYLPQLSSVFPKLTAVDNLMVYLERSSLPRRRRLEKAHEALQEFGIAHIAQSKAHQLSGGERRRLEVCRALLLEPTYLLLDEPFAGIDPVAIEDLQRLIRVVAERGIGVLITDHNVRETLRLVDRAYLIHLGNVFLEGTPESIASSPQAREIYLGEGFSLT